jgi:hypothetical protein
VHVLTAAVVSGRAQVGRDCRSLHSWALSTFWQFLEQQVTWAWAHTSAGPSTGEAAPCRCFAALRFSSPSTVGNSSAISAPCRPPGCGTIS